LQPRFIDEHFLVGRMPERTNLLDLASGRKSLLLHPESNKVFEVVGFGITAPGLPFPHRLPGNPEPLSQFCLRQPGVCPQRYYQLPKGVVSLTIGESHHIDLPFS
jgi:hypothetical protein